MQKYLFLFLFSMIAFVASGQTITLTGEVIDPITGEGIHEATVKVVDAQSDSVLATTKAQLNLIVEERDGNSTGYLDTKSGAAFSLKIASEHHDVVLIISALRYESVRKNVHIDAGQKRLDVGTIHLLPAAKERNLNEATLHSEEYTSTA